MSVLISRYVPGLAPMSKDTLFDLPKIESTTHDVYIGKQGESEFNMFAYIHHDGEKFLALWGSHPTNVEGAPGQRAMWATSQDAKTWNYQGYIGQDVYPSFWDPKGFWERDGELIVLLLKDGSGASKQLVGFVQDDSGEWLEKYEIFGSALATYPPIKHPDGDWMIPLRDADGIYINKGDVGGWRRIDVPGNGQQLIEPALVVGKQGRIMVSCRNQSGTHLARSVGFGEEFPALSETNLPDCQSKHQCIPVSPGLYCLCSNINNPNDRTKIHLSFSEDGYSFNQSWLLRDDPSEIRYGGSSVRLGFQYPNLTVVGDKIYAIYSENKEDIKVSIVNVSV